MNFKDFPLTLGEQRSRNGRADQWEPRDLLIHMLRLIDSGELKCGHLIMAFVDEELDLGWKQAGNLVPWVQMGMLERTKQLIAETAEEA